MLLSLINGPNSFINNIIIDLSCLYEHLRNLLFFNLSICLKAHLICQCCYQWSKLLYYNYPSILTLTFEIWSCLMYIRNLFNFNKHHLWACFFFTILISLYINININQVSQFRRFPTITLAFILQLLMVGNFLQESFTRKNNA